MTRLSTSIFVVALCLPCAHGVQLRLEGRYPVDDSSGLGLTWEGVGAISGGGATSKLLYDYPRNVSSKILDILFKPSEGVSLQMLKVEIGGDTDSTEGAEPSHMHFDGDENYNRGYEWWLMKEAKKRNPDIKLYGLPWGWPGTLDSEAVSYMEAKHPFESVMRTANYTLSWLRGAEKVHGLKIDYVGLWNEMDAPEEYTEALRMAVANSDLEHKSQVLDRMVHYPGSTNDPDPQGCQQHKDAGPGTLWADEEGSTFDGRSARCLARVLNRNYVSKCHTATFQWHLVSSFYDYLPWPRCGLAVADQPWSGHFEITSPAWAIAHTTQFAQIGWRYAAHGAGVTMLDQGGSMVTRISPDNQHFSIVIEKIDPSNSVCGHGENPYQEVKAEEVVIELKNSFLSAVRAAGGLRVWRSNLWSTMEYGDNPPNDEIFQKQDDLPVPEDGVLRLWVHPEELFTLTTLTSGHKKQPKPPPAQPFPVPYHQAFDEESVGSPPALWYDQMGAWEVQRSPYGDAEHRGNVMRQVVPIWPNCWGYSCEPPVTYIAPSTLGGDVTVSLDVLLEEEGAISLSPVGLNYMMLQLSTSGVWRLGTKEHGNLSFPAMTWHSVNFRMKPDGTQDVHVNGERLTKLNPHFPNVQSTFLRLHDTAASQETQCDEDTFPIPITGQRFLLLKPVPRAQTVEWCRKACCRDENLCDVWQFDPSTNTCQMGRAAGGYVKDPTRTWVGGRRWQLSGWHLKVKLSKYMYASIDNFRIENSSMASA